MLAQETLTVDIQPAGISTGFGNDTDGASASGMCSIQRYAIRARVFDGDFGRLVHRSIPFDATGSANAERNSACGKNAACNSSSRFAPPAATITCGPKKNVATEAAKPVDCCVIVGRVSGSDVENAGRTAWSNCTACCSDG